MMTMLESLFTSRVRAKLLAIFMLTPGVEYNAWELAHDLSENYNAVWKELVHLEQIKILASEHRGRSKIYRVNSSCSILSELRSIVIKTEGLQDAIRGQLLDARTVRAAFIYGSYASGEADFSSDLDLMVIGDVNLNQFAPVITKLERELKRSINYVIYSDRDWITKLSESDPFVINVIRSPKIMLIGDEHAI